MVKRWESLRVLLVVLAAFALVGVACKGNVEINADQPQDDPTEAPVEEPTVAPTAPPTPEPEPEPEPTAAEEPTEAPADDQIDEALLDSLLDNDLPESATSCLISTITSDQLVADALLELGPDELFDDLDPRIQVVVIDQLLGCLDPADVAPFFVGGLAEGLAGSGVGLPAGSGDCIAQEIASSSQRTEIVIGLLALGTERSPQPAVQGPIVELFTVCMPASLLIDAFVLGIGDDPDIAAAIDQACLETNYGDEENRRTFWSTIVAAGSNAFDDLPPEQQLGIIQPLFDCISFGTVIANQASADGVIISDTSIACIDEAVRSSGLLGSIVTGQEPDQNELVELLFGCLTPDEINALGGS